MSSKSADHVLELIELKEQTARRRDRHAQALDKAERELAAINAAIAACSDPAKKALRRKS